MWTATVTKRTLMSQPDDSDSLSYPVSATDRIQGSLDAPVILVQYGDYLCPHCAETVEIVRSLQQQYGDRLSFVFRYFPLTQIHPQAQNAAEAAEVAAEQGQFWQMHARMFEHQSALDDGSLVEHAIALGLNMSRFLWNLSQHVYAKRVQADLLSGVRSGVTGTPTFFLNGIRLKESWELDNLCIEIERALNR